jgi:glutathione-independent formaldehyde dehydrogenase
MGLVIRHAMTKNPRHEKPTRVLENCVGVLNVTGDIGVIGVYIAPGPGANDEQSKKGQFTRFLSLSSSTKGITNGGGQAPVKKYNEHLGDLIVTGHAKPSRTVSHHIQIDELPTFMTNSISE